MDVFPSGDYLLVVIDDYSRFARGGNCEVDIGVEPIVNTSSIIVYTLIFVYRQGIPEVAKSDNVNKVPHSMLKTSRNG